MERGNNYLIQAQQAKGIFLGYDQEALIRKLGLEYDEAYFYVMMLCKPYRIHRATGDLQKREPWGWADANTHGEVMTLLDLVCDSREDRFISGRWKQMQSFGLMFHQNLLEDARDPWAEKIQGDMAAFERACRALEGEKMSGGDVSYAIELFDGLRIWVQFWEGDEEFPPRVRFLWDENARMYLKYETMYFAVGLLRGRIDEEMERLSGGI